MSKEKLARRLAAAESRMRGEDDAGGPVIAFVDDLGGGRYRNTSTGEVYEENTLPRGSILVLWENVCEVQHDV